MARKKPTPEDIVAFRDDAPTVTKGLRRAIAENQTALESLANARILALALTLLRQKDGEQRGLLPHADALVAYLQNSMSGLDRQKLEGLLRGNGDALAFLIELRDALSGNAKAEDISQLAVPASSARVELGVVKYRSDGPSLIFRRQEPTADYSLGLLEVSFQEPSLEFAPMFLEEERSKYEGEPESLASFLDRRGRLSTIEKLMTDALEAIRETLADMDTDPARAKEMREYLQPASHSGRLESAIERLQHELMMATKLGLVTYSARAQFREAHVSEAIHQRKPFFSRQQPRPRERWSESLALRHHEVCIELSGMAEPNQTLVLAVSQSAQRIKSEAEITIVQAGHDFTTAVCNGDGECKMSLPNGDVIVLVDLDLTYKFQLERAKR